MRVKIIGIGKCGSRLTYDFFAYVSDTPTAYEIKPRNSSKLWSYIVDNNERIASFNQRLRKLGLSRQQLSQELFGEFLIFDPAVLVALDSDTRNNEIIHWIQFINEQGRTFVFPGKTFNLASHTGGCDYHIVSENICLNWDVEPAILEHDNADFVVTAFSIGGGTGGGSAPIISFKSKQKILAEKRSETEQMHFMGVGILPFSDEAYREEMFVPDMSSAEKYNVGRFFVNLYGHRSGSQQVTYSEMRMDSVWLFSNDIARVAFNSYDEEEGNANLSHINKYLAASLTVICNSSSNKTQSEPNFDPSEMNSRLNGYPFMSGYSLGQIEKSGAHPDLHANTVRGLLRTALNNPSFLSDMKQLQGLSVPVRESELVEVNRILDEKGHERFLASLATYDINKAPLEFRTASRAIVIYGQPHNHHSPFKDDLVAKVTSTLFKNSDFDSYFYKHPGGTDILLVLIVNPFIGLVQNAVYYYTDLSFATVDSDELDEQLNRILISKRFDSASLTKMLADEEKLSDEFHGANILDLVESFETPAKLKKVHVIRAFSHLQRSLHHRKVKTRRGGDAIRSIVLD